MEKNGKKSGDLKEKRTKGNNSYSSFKTSLGDRTLTGDSFSSLSTSNSTSCEDASQTCIMYPASCIRQTPIGVISKSQLPNPKHYAVTFFSSSARRTLNSAIFSITGIFASGVSNLEYTASNLKSTASNLEYTASNFVIISLLKLAISFSTPSMRVCMAFISPLGSFSFSMSSRSCESNSLNAC